jgi:uncharacterized protein (TIGR03067 family)
MSNKRMLSVVAVLALLAPAGADDKNKEAKLDPAKLVGTWNIVSGERNGQKVDEDSLKKNSVVITKDTLTLKTEMGDFVMKYKVDTKKTPCQIELEITEGPAGQGTKATGIIQLKGEELKLCYPAMGGDAPKDFTAKEDSGNHSFVLKKKK